MVLYYGRMKMRTGSVNTDQKALMLSGSAGTTGRRGYLIRYINSRVNSNLVRCKYLEVDATGKWVPCKLNAHNAATCKAYPKAGRDPITGKLICGCGGCIDSKKLYSNRGVTVLL